ncbi:nucleoside ABC transporter membrane protein [Gibbsiella quercinecans]|uniref:Sugar ABC transporter permease n=1 Tax=Gibbsiella quercinecans TaxID=929813 RepID=A0A250B1V5_9GAMM|nr:ABC transporter permease [Gibbsiella quercinecans]ATA20169.1 sugar ABC transporter permease [Gibbsiella quercinecans]RLM07988.1 sugar ABC transporter permease [Gibbsiella quercinecans]RLM08978.1 sugar ABC transporter permease [Gibbsiella quercinecans]TCT86558.1 nucleoside ABC transporter membrane protein [Gibbsiella quercinecans]
MKTLLEKRLAPADSALAITSTSLGAILAAFFLAGLLFIPFGGNPITAYGFLFSEAFGTLRGFGLTLVQSTPLILIALATIVIWRAGLGYIGFEGCFLVGAAVASWMALAGTPQGLPWALPVWAYWPLVLISAFLAGALWAGWVGALRVRFGGNDVLISLMANYVAIFLVQYLVSGPMRAPGDLPQTPRLPVDSWLAYLMPGMRAHWGIAIALVATLFVWWLIRATPAGYEIIVSGLNPKAARYGGIQVGQRQMSAVFLGGGLAALAGLCAVLGVQHRLMEGLSGGVGFIGVVVALLARLNPVLVIPTAILYGGLEVGGSAMQRQSGLPTSVVLILQSLVVLLILAGDVLRYYRLRWPGQRPSATQLSGDRP